jgi:hypothetical protein
MLDWGPADAQLFAEYLDRLAMSFEVPKAVPFQASEAMTLDASKATPVEVSQ